MRGSTLIVSALIFAASGSGGGCGAPPRSPAGGAGGNGSGDGGVLSEEVQRVRRERMVETQIRARGVQNARVLDAMRSVPRHLFVPPSAIEDAYTDGPLPIGEGQTISQPYIVALMTELLEPGKDQRVLEIGTGSGYQAAILSGLVRQVYTIEIVEPLARRAESLLKGLGYANVQTRVGDGYRGWPEAAPFDGIVVTAAPETIPEPLKEQLKIGGRLVIPVGSRWQELVVVTRTADGFEERSVTPVRFVPMTGEAQNPH